MKIAIGADGGGKPLLDVVTVSDMQAIDKLDSNYEKSV